VVFGKKAHFLGANVGANFGNALTNKKALEGIIKAIERFGF